MEVIYVGPTVQFSVWRSEMGVWDYETWRRKRWRQLRWSKYNFQELYNVQSFNTSFKGKLVKIQISSTGRICEFVQSR